jgi:hypothetical protein
VRLPFHNDTTRVVDSVSNSGWETKNSQYISIQYQILEKIVNIYQILDEKLKKIGNIYSRINYFSLSILYNDEESDGVWT